MRLNIRKINNYSYYSIIKDYTNLDGKILTNDKYEYDIRIKE